jgi:hypothetical protein
MEIVSNKIFEERKAKSLKLNCLTTADSLFSDYAHDFGRRAFSAF